jgi:hypothetical protein
MNDEYFDDESEEIPKNAEDWEETDFPYGMKVEPEKYIDRGIILAQQALVSENTRDGMLKYCLLVNNISMIAIAAKKITEEEIKTIPQSTQKDDLLKQVDKANELLKKIIESVISSKPIRKKLVLDPEKAPNV